MELWLIYWMHLMYMCYIRYSYLNWDIDHTRDITLNPKPWEKLDGR